MRSSALFLLFVLSITLGLWLWGRIIRRIREQHPEVWVSMGSPESIPSGSVARSILFGRDMGLLEDGWLVAMIDRLRWI